jgi:N-acetylglucosaminyldiphosphoundecaprenol N-acetyl-beta-D-mannosaminyltransferase
MSTTLHSSPSPDAVRAGRTARIEPSEPFEFCGLSLAGLDLEGALEWITAQARAESSAIVVTPNINHLHLVQSSDDARRALQTADLQLADGWPIVAASRILGSPLPGRIAGIDLVQALIDSDAGFSVAILGGSDDSATRLAERVALRNRVVLVDELRSGWDTPRRRSELTARVAEAKPNLILVAVGAPRQELLAHELKDVVSGPIICCGAAVEVLAGARPRAPRFLQSIGMEWAFRLAIEPRRLCRRYIVAGATFLRLLAVAAFWRSRA